MKSFAIRLAAIAMALATLFLAEALILGTLPLLLCVALLPAAAVSSARLFKMGAKPAGSRVRQPRRTPPTRHGNAAARPLHQGSVVVRPQEVENRRAA